MKKLVLLFALLFPATLQAGTFPQICPNELASWVKAKKDISIIDIQNSEGYRSHNYANSLETHNDLLLLKKIVAKLRNKRNRVIVVSDSGGAEAEQTAEQLVKWGVLRSRISLLEGGMEAAAQNAACQCCRPTSLAGTSK